MPFETLHKIMCVCVCVQNKCICVYKSTGCQGWLKIGILWFQNSLLNRHKNTTTPPWNLASGFLFQSILWQSYSFCNTTQPYPENSQSQGDSCAFPVTVHFSHPRVELERVVVMPPLHPLKPFKSFPVTGGELTGLQFSSVTGSVYCHFPFLRDTACIKSAFENVNKGFALFSLVSSLLSFLGRHCECPLGTLSISWAANLSIMILMLPGGYLCISQFIIFNPCLLRFIYVVVFLRSWNLIECNLTRDPEPEFLANKGETVLMVGISFAIDWISSSCTLNLA